MYCAYMVSLFRDLGEFVRICSCRHSTHNPTFGVVVSLFIFFGSQMLVSPPRIDRFHSFKLHLSCIVSGVFVVQEERIPSCSSCCSFVSCSFSPLSFLNAFVIHCVLFFVMYTQGNSKESASTKCHCCGHHAVGSK